jgi:hypothetical protein
MSERAMQTNQKSRDSHRAPEQACVGAANGCIDPGHSHSIPDAYLVMLDRDALARGPGWSQSEYMTQQFECGPQDTPGPGGGMVGADGQDQAALRAALNAEMQAKAAYAEKQAALMRAEQVAFERREAAHPDPLWLRLRHAHEALELAAHERGKLVDEIVRMRDAMSTMKWERGRMLQDIDMLKHAASCAGDRLRERDGGERVAPEMLHSLIAGALFDLMGRLTCSDERLVLSSRDDAAPSAHALEKFALDRGLNLTEADVVTWQDKLVGRKPPPAPLRDYRVDNLFKSAAGAGPLVHLD